MPLGEGLGYTYFKGRQVVSQFHEPKRLRRHTLANAYSRTMGEVMPLEILERLGNLRLTSLESVFVAQPERGVR